MPRTKKTLDSESSRACVSLDDLTLAVLERIRRKSNLTRQQALKMIVSLTLEKKITPSEVAHFQSEVWSKVPSQHGQRFSQVGLEWSPEERAILHAFSIRLFGSHNLSQAMRMLILYYAVRHKLVVTEQVTTLEFVLPVEE